MKKLWIWVQLLFNKYGKYKLFRLKDYNKPVFEIESQGLAVYQDKYLFQGSDQSGKQSSLLIIDIDTKKIISEFDLGTFGGHMNNICIGPKWTETDKFPLLYISECRHQHKCFVLRLLNDLSEYQIVQVIKFESKNHYGKCKNAFDWFLDEGLCTFGMTDNPGEIEIIKFPYIGGMGGFVLTDEHIIDSFKIDNINVYQGTFAFGGILYALSGLDNSEYPTYLNVINLQKKLIEDRIPIKGLGELEGIGRYKDGFIVVNCAYNPTYTFIKLKS